MASGDLKRYAPTARHLERLRRAGVVPSSRAATGAAVVLLATLAMALWGREGVNWLAGGLARDLQYPNVDNHRFDHI